MNDTVKNLIEQYEENGDFTHATVTDEMIAAAENALGVKLPQQYIDFLQMYGHGGIGGIETLGIGLDNSMVFVEATLDYRNEEMPDNLVVIENVDEWLNCIDCNTQKIVSWDLSGYIKEDYSCFDEYLLDQMHDAIENM